MGDSRDCFCRRKGWGYRIYGRFGVLKLGESAPVDENSLFGIASVSKHITASSLAVLVDEGKIKWDDPVIKHIPWFRLSDPWATEHRSEEHTSELQSRGHLVCRLLLEKKNTSAWAVCDS